MIAVPKKENSKMEIQKKIKEKNALYPAIKTSMKRKYLI